MDNIVLDTNCLIMALSSRNVRRIVPSYYWHLIEADPDDNKFVDCALSANATFIVTEDHHFSVLREISFPHVDIVSIDDFLKILSAD